ncbi:Gmc oxidoreductase [Aspergillus sclerotialis]|uniref:Gmc oxidoreductase n=1 Tax=Aspergillus sclerotialis TaxID=2070753 RepID=A0A3A2ZWS2_9EURO|nr:Gmc oxidoreductase [Aspergillus sclerotialis]
MQANKALALLAVLATVTYAAPAPPHIQSRGLLGTSFGVPGKNATFDYIVVGGGTAGLTLATRLAEQQTGSVAVIEAGGFYEIDNGNISQIPAMDGRYTGTDKDDWHPLIDWGYITTPQAGSYGREMHYARGKCLGGSSSRNYMAYHRGTKSSYQRWADAVGDQSFTFDELLPYFEKSLKFTPPNMDARFKNSTPEYDPTVLGDGSGPLSVTYSNYASAFATWAVKGLKAIGIPIGDGFQSGSLMGQSYFMLTINATTMVRESSETSFLREGLGRSNYMVYQSTMAKRILFDENKKATTVVVDTNGLTFSLSARKEIIVTAGVFGSPQLLMVSGIGPAVTLSELDIPVVADRPGVGQNMQDQIYFGPSYRVNAPTMSALGYPDFAAQAAKQFNENATGMYTNPTTDLLAWEKIPQSLRSKFSNETLAKLATYPADWPEVEYITLSVYLGDLRNSATGDPHDGHNYATLAVALGSPLSVGNLSISSADTADPPLINPNWLTDPADVEVAVAGYKRVREFWQSEAMEPFVIGDEAFPGSHIQTDAQIEDTIRKSFSPIFHAACTCSMGRVDDPMAVVDSQSQVIGVKGLRVVDASVFPLLPPGHPQATVCMFPDHSSMNETS